VKRFYYTAFRDDTECEGIIRASSIDSARKKLADEGYEEITLSVLSSVPYDSDQEGTAESRDFSQPPT
jgi:hypothetical protein